jgi:hypothetical protein
VRVPSVLTVVVELTISSYNRADKSTMSFRDLSPLDDNPYDGFCGLPQIDFRRVGRVLCLGLLTEQENRSWCGR